MDASDAVLEELASALADERGALLEHDAERLMRSTHAKLAALRSLEANPPGEYSERLAELAEVNRANGALLARRRREVNWALRHLGRSESAPAYDIHGQAQQVHVSRELAVA